MQTFLEEKNRKSITAEGPKSAGACVFQFLTHRGGKTMSTPELLKDLLITILCIQKELNGSDEGKVKAAQEAYRYLLDGFYEEYQNIMARQQYDAAKDDPDYFIALIQLAYYYYQGQAIFDSDGDQAIFKPDWKLFTRI